MQSLTRGPERTYQSSLKSRLSAKNMPVDLCKAAAYRFKVSSFCSDFNKRAPTDHQGRLRVLTCAVKGCLLHAQMQSHASGSVRFSALWRSGYWKDTATWGYSCQVMAEAFVLSTHVTTATCLVDWKLKADQRHHALINLDFLNEPPDYCSTWFKPVLGSYIKHSLS